MLYRIIMSFLLLCISTATSAGSNYLFEEKIPRMKFLYNLVAPGVNKNNISIGKGKFIGSRFSIYYQLVKAERLLTSREMEVLDKAFFTVHWIIYNTDYLKRIGDMSFNSLSGREVAARIKFTSYKIRLAVIDSLKDNKGNAMYGLGELNKNSIHLNSNRLTSEIGAARTIFHEMTHNIGFAHSKHEFIHIFGKLMQEYYDKNKEAIEYSYSEFSATST